MHDASKAEAVRRRRWATALVLGTALPVVAGTTGLGARATPLLPAHTTRAQPRTLRIEGDFAHPSGFALPERVGPFERVEVTQFDEAGWNLAAGYNALLGEKTPLPVVATLYVYPRRSGQDLDAYFERLLSDIGGQHGAARPDFQKSIELGAGLNGRFAVLGYAEPWSGATRDVPLRSYLVLYPWKTWWVKWRVTTPAPIDALRMQAIVDLTKRLLPPMPDEPYPRSGSA